MTSKNSRIEALEKHNRVLEKQLKGKCKELASFELTTRTEAITDIKQKELQISDLKKELTLKRQRIVSQEQTIRDITQEFSNCKVFNNNQNR